ncbi:MAG: tRNA (cytidine(56)-2'-O)-methyltransferase [Methanobacterium sp.]|uniref:tRNA (cytidine(56)-2'-O)-methyltransferase n=1 Tax=Methanobacterium sp. TaxID=2164 RepID=UPI003C71DF7C
MKVNVLRLDHRRVRDARITTHVCLTSRAFGASKVILSGDEDKKIMENIRDVVKRWGGDFEIDYVKKWDKFIDDWKNNGGEVVHLTMYGEPVQSITNKIRESSRDKLVVVGGSRVPSKVYQEADWNVSVTSQPHSEVAALSIFLHTLFEGEEYDIEFNDSELKVIPTAHGKQVITRKRAN